MTERILPAPRFNEGWIPAFAGMTSCSGSLSHGERVGVRGPAAPPFNASTPALW